MRKMAEGAEADIYEDKVLGVNAILKRRRRKPYIAPELERELRMQRTRTEARIIGTLNGLGLNVPALLMVGRDTIRMVRIDGTPLNEVRGLPRMRAIADSGQLLGRLHAVGIAHGDFTTANMMISRDGALWLIDFGLASQHASPEDKAMDVLLLKRSVNAEEYAAFARAYMKWQGAQQVMRRLASIERRGRYQTRTLESR